LYNLFIQRVIPDSVFKKPVKNYTNIYISNNSALRSCLYKGIVNYDDVLSIIPFAESFYHIEGVIGYQLIKLLNTTDRYRYSLIDIEEESDYDVICTLYDCNVAVIKLEALYPKEDWEKSLYLETSSTMVFRNWLNKNFKC